MTLTGMAKNLWKLPDSGYSGGTDSILIYGRAFLCFFNSKSRSMGAVTAEEWWPIWSWFSSLKWWLFIYSCFFVSCIHLYPSVSRIPTACRHFLPGPTFHVKEDLKKLGAKFNGQTKAWVITKKERHSETLAVGIDGIVWSKLNMVLNGEIGYQTNTPIGYTSQKTWKACCNISIGWFLMDQWSVYVWHPMTSYGFWRTTLDCHRGRKISHPEALWEPEAAIYLAYCDVPDGFVYRFVGQRGMKYIVFHRFRWLFDLS